jgi:putative restriction endonuclease
MPVIPEQLRAAAAHAITNLVKQRGDILRWDEIERGFQFGSENVRFANKARGIFKPKQLNDGAPLSIRTSRPSRPGRQASYNDEQISSEVFRYKFRGTNPDHHDNKWLYEAFLRRIPLIYFSGISDATYQVFFPVFVERIDRTKLEAVLGFQPPNEVDVAEPISIGDNPEREYQVRSTKVRLHQARFRANVLEAYSYRCALSGLPIGSLLNAAHIVPDADARGVPTVNNGICMSVFHHAAFDANLMGIDPECRVHMGSLLRATKDGPLLEEVLRPLDGQRIALPGDRRLQPDRSLLDHRFKAFLEAQIS